jgi:methylmalonyl-CoA mutase cobalamin-binding subunit
MEVIYSGRGSRRQIAAATSGGRGRRRSLHSPAHNVLFPESEPAEEGRDIVAAYSIIPDKDIANLKALGIREIFLPGTSTVFVEFVRRRRDGG